MLKIVCPNCQHSSSISQPKAGKFSPVCSRCKTKFQLSIKEQPDGTYVSKVALFPAASENAGAAAPPSPKSPSSTHFSSTPPASTPPAKTPPVKTPPVKTPKQDLEVTRESSNPASPKSNFADETFASVAKPGPSSQSRGVEKTKVEPVTAPGSKFDPNEATSVASKAHTEIASKADPDRNRTNKGVVIGSNLGPYRLIKLLGQGGMGSVYLAKQTSLDRDVALKVINSQLSDSPKAMARFTREAYAAAQLVHPNVVQVYDMGDDKGNCYFSMELVSGKSLADFVANEKRLDPEQAASFILHAARGLAHAHAAGMVHRDIKPGNLLVDGSGACKVADLGLVKVPDQEEIEQAADIAQMSALSASQDLTRFGSAIGTPYYMAPEQAKNAVTVDHRADIYSLGCTFYVLLTGKKPFDGKTFEEIVSKHNTAPIIQPSQLVERVPASLSGIVSKMMAKDPKDRYQSLNELIPVLEKFLGIASPANFTPEEDDVNVLEQNANEFNGVKLAPLRGLIPAALFAGSLFMALIILFAFSWRWASSFALIPIFAVAAYFIFSGLRDHGPLFSKARELVFESGILSWAKWTFAGIILIAAAFLIDLLFPWIFAAMVGSGLGIGFYFVIDRLVNESRKEPISAIEQLLKKMRIKGMDEIAIATFVAKYSGKHWEELYEHLFGYDAKRRMRDDLAKSEMAKSRPKFRGWRDRIYDGWCSQLNQLKSAKERKHLAKVEFAGLKAEGLSVAEARERAGQMAEAIVDHAAEQKIAALEQRIAELDPKVRGEQKREKVKQLLADARSGKYRKEKTLLQKIEPILNRYAGGYTRFLLGCLLVVGSMLWARQNGILTDLKDSAARVQQALNQPNNAPKSDGATSAEGEIKPDDAKTIDGSSPTVNAQAALKSSAANVINKQTEPLKFPLLGGVFHNFNSLVAGLLLIASAFIFGWRMSIFALPATFITLFGASFIGDFENIPTIHSLSAIIGVAIFALGIVFGRADD